MIHPIWVVYAALNAKFSVKLNSDFRRIYSRGKQCVTPCLVVYARKNRSSVNRFGYTVSSKIGHAVVRNRIRRKLREITRLNAPDVRTGYDIIVVARHKCRDADYWKLNSAYLQACRELGLLYCEKP